MKPTEFKKSDIVTVCAWCPKDSDAEDPGPNVSHGICKPCAEKLEADAKGLCAECGAQLDARDRPCPVCGAGC